MLILSNWINRVNATTNKTTAGSDVDIEMLALRYTGRRKEAQNSYPVAGEAQSQSAGTIQSSRPAQ